MLVGRRDRPSRGQAGAERLFPLRPVGAAPPRSARTRPPLSPGPPRCPPPVPPWSQTPFICGHDSLAVCHISPALLSLCLSHTHTHSLFSLSLILNHLRVSGSCDSGSFSQSPKNKAILSRTHGRKGFFPLFISGTIYMCGVCVCVCVCVCVYIYIYIYFFFFFSLRGKQ